jgi:hypothetical protein
MRKIEQQMIEAIRSKQDWKSYKNAKGYPAMEVVHVRENGINYADIYLHANLIATATPDTWDARPYANPNRATVPSVPKANAKPTACTGCKCVVSKTVTRISTAWRCCNG